MTELYEIKILDTYKNEYICKDDILICESLNKARAICSIINGSATLKATFEKYEYNRNEN